MTWISAVATLATVGVAAPPARSEDDLAIVRACTEILLLGLRPLAAERIDRFLGKVSEAHALCWGGGKAAGQRGTPWVDWSNFWAAGDIDSRSDRRDIGGHVLDRNTRAIDGALINLEYQRMELIRFNLFDNKTFEQYATGGGRAADGSTLKTWNEMRLPADHPAFGQLQVGADGSQLCQGELIRHRTLTGICNDIRNPAMGSTGQLFARSQARMRSPRAPRRYRARSRPIQALSMPKQASQRQRARWLAPSLCGPRPSNSSGTASTGPARAT
jgi:hypothetical protein